MDSSKVLFNKLFETEEKYNQIENELQIETNKISGLNLLKNQESLKYIVKANVKVFNHIEFLDNSDFEISNPSESYFINIEVYVNERFYWQLINLGAKLNININNGVDVQNKNIDFPKSIKDLITIVIPHKNPIDAILKIQIIIEDKLWTIIPIMEECLNISYFIQIQDRPFNPKVMYPFGTKIVNIIAINEIDTEVAQLEDITVKLSDSISVKRIYEILLKNCSHQSKGSILDKFIKEDFKKVNNEFLKVGKNGAGKIIIDVGKRIMQIYADRIYLKKIVEYLENEFKHK